ncbi:MAG: phosphoadenylyl-sulfate reductase [Bacteroidetes bacterium]|nr:MAG: phosphoadenylyl-sulfate reductase [Bacteroidota bacterium]
MNLKTLCEQYSQYDHRKRLEAIFRDFDRVLVTSSFGTSSAIFLHLLHQVRPDHPVHFIDTRYHFPETYAYRDLLAKRWNLNVVSVQPKVNEHLFTQLNYTWAHHPDACCHMNKVMPLEDLKARHDLWISGMAGSPTDLRRRMPMFKQDRKLIRFYPLLDMSPQDVALYKTIYELPEHPLEKEGYGSIGCQHCTRKGDGRSGRWVGFQKTECGLHITKH